MVSVVSISDIVFVIQSIKDAVDRVESNTLSSKRICERLKNIEFSLKKLRDTDDIVNNKLQKFFNTLEEIRSFVGTFDNRSYVMKIYSRSSDADIFNDFNEQLNQHILSLQLDLTIDEIQQRREDMEDRERDFEKILSTMNELLEAQKLTRQDYQSTRQILEIQMEFFKSQCFRQTSSQKLILDKDSLKQLRELISTTACTPKDFYNNLKIIEKSEIRENYEYLGSGGFGKVFRTSYRNMGHVAIKYVKDDILLNHDGNDILRKLKKECLIMQLAHCPGVISFIGLIEVEPYAIVMELAICSLYQVLHDEKCNFFGELSIAKKIEIALTCCDTLDYLHSLDIIHRDIKSANFLITSDKKVKLSDFGLSKAKAVSTPKSLATSSKAGPKGTYVYIAPELFNGSKRVYNKSTDVYAMSVTINEIFSQAKPFSELGGDNLNLHFKMVETKFKMRPNLFTCDESNILLKYLQHLIEAGWHDDSYKRPSARAMANKLDFLSKHKDDKNSPNLLSTMQHQQASIHSQSNNRICDNERVSEEKSLLAGQSPSKVKEEKMFKEVKTFKESKVATPVRSTRNLNQDQLADEKSDIRQLERLHSFNAEKDIEAIADHDRVHDLCSRIIETILTLKCPKCECPFIIDEFDGLAACNCVECECVYCAFCFQGFDDRDSCFFHVVNCDLNPSEGEEGLFIPPDLYHSFQNLRQKELIENLLKYETRNVKESVKHLLRFQLVNLDIY